MHAVFGPHCTPSNQERLLHRRMRDSNNQTGKGLPDPRNVFKAFVPALLCGEQNLGDDEKRSCFSGTSRSQSQLGSAGADRGGLECSDLSPLRNLDAWSNPADEAIEFLTSCEVLWDTVPRQSTALTRINIHMYLSDGPRPGSLNRIRKMLAYHMTTHGVGLFADPDSCFKSHPATFAWFSWIRFRAATAVAVLIERDKIYGRDECAQASCNGERKIKALEPSLATYQDGTHATFELGDVMTNVEPLGACEFLDLLKECPVIYPNVFATVVSISVQQAENTLLVTVSGTLVQTTISRHHQAVGMKWDCVRIGLLCLPNQDVADGLTSDSNS
ncbi:hypothetical protein BDR06DRAFT_995719 [Suillus hirtellus]|nr:hypothetical protein BDR06DRAFT_995719 [Suillus hirtellus]